MANSAQARKRARQAEVTRQRNAGLRSALRTAVKKVRKAIDAGNRNRRQYESDADLASLRELPRFKELMQRL